MKKEQLNKLGIISLLIILNGSQFLPQATYLFLLIPLTAVLSFGLVLKVKQEKSNNEFQIKLYVPLIVMISISITAFGCFYFLIK